MTCGCTDFNVDQPADWMTAHSGAFTSKLARVRKYQHELKKLLNDLQQRIPTLPHAN